MNLVHFGHLEGSILEGRQKADKKNRTTVPVFQEFSSSSTPLLPAPPFLPIFDPFNGDLKRPTQKADS